MFSWYLGTSSNFGMEFVHDDWVWLKGRVFVNFDLHLRLRPLFFAIGPWHWMLQPNLQGHKLMARLDLALSSRFDVERRKKGMCFFVFFCVSYFQMNRKCACVFFLQAETRLCFWTEPRKHVCVLKRKKKTRLCFGIDLKNANVFFIWQRKHQI